MLVVELTWYNDALVDSSSTLILDPNKLNISDAILDLIDRIEMYVRNVFLIRPLMIPGYDLPSKLSHRVKFGGIVPKSVNRHVMVDKKLFNATSYH